MNSHIKKYLKNYINYDNPEFAILLNGKWGSGKTYFIDKFIKDNEEKDKLKFIKISLFGLKEVDSIDEQIFQNLHPLLGNKYVKLTGNIAKNVLKFGMKLDWKDDTKADGTATIDLSKFNPLDYFSDEKKSKVKIIFVFDDLERTDIDLIEVLGYINYLVEQSEFNVIILANEEKLKDKDKDNNNYLEFKEKVIGKTFEVQHNLEEILISFIHGATDKSKKYLNDNKSIIQDIYTKAAYNNLRHIKQILLDFEYFIRLVDEKYLENQEFISILINNFFALSIELKSGSLGEQELYDKPNFNFNFDKEEEKSNVEKVYEKYYIDKNLIFSGKGWVMVLLKNSLNSNVINEVFSELSFFLEKEENQRPSWVKLWHYQELENIEFEDAKKDVLSKFNDFKYETPQYFLHVIALLIFFSKKELVDLTFEQIEEQVVKSIERYKQTNTWKEKLFDDRISFNGTGLGYKDEESEEFRKLYKLIMDENKKIYYENEKIKEKHEVVELLKAMKDNDEEIIQKLLLTKYKETRAFKIPCQPQLVT